MGKNPSQEKIGEEEWELNQNKDELKALKKKWIKIPSTLRRISFLEYYIKEKEKFIESLKKFKHKKT